MRRRTALWVLAAVLGLAIAAAVSWATSTLTSQHIGLASEPVTAGRSLAPAEAPRTRSAGKQQKTTPGSPAAPTSAPSGSPTLEAEPTSGGATSATTPTNTPRGGADDGSAGGAGGRDD